MYHSFIHSNLCAHIFPLICLELGLPESKFSKLNGLFFSGLKCFSHAQIYKMLGDQGLKIMEML